MENCPPIARIVVRWFTLYTTQGLEPQTAILLYHYITILFRDKILIINVKSRSVLLFISLHNKNIKVNEKFRIFALVSAIINEKVSKRREFINWSANSLGAERKFAISIYFDISLSNKLKNITLHDFTLFTILLCNA